MSFLMSTDSVDNPYIIGSKKFITVSVAPLFAEAVHRIHERVSVSGLFTNVPDKMKEYCE